MKKKRSETRPVEVKPGAKRVTRNGTRQQLDEEPAATRIEPRFLLKESPVGKFCPDVRRNPDLQSREMDPSLEETLLAFLDAHGAREVDDIEEDKLAFLDATYARSGVQAHGSVPTQKMFQAIFRNIQDSQSDELTMASFQLLKDLEKRHPQVAVQEELDKTSGQTTLRLDIDKRVWSPLEQTIADVAATEKMLPESSADEPVPLNLLELVETIVTNISEYKRQPIMGFSHDVASCHKGVTNLNILGQFLMLQHLVTLVQKDLYCRLQVSEARMDAGPVRKSYFYKLLCALLPDVRKTFFSNLVFMLNSNPEQINEETADDKLRNECMTPLTPTKYVEESKKPGLLPSTSDFSHLAYRLLLMVVEIDYVTKKWNPGNTRSMRKGCFPTDILDIFSNTSDLGAYLQALDSPRTKLRFIVDYFVTYASPTGIVVKGLEDSIDQDTMEKLLACFEEEKTVKFVHKFSEDALPLLLAHAFQASVILHAEAADQDDEEERGAHKTKLMIVSQSLINTLTDLRELERQTEMLAVAEHALEMAESILTS